MNEKSIIYVAGHTGLVGSAITRSLDRSGFDKQVVPNKPIDLRRFDVTVEFFLYARPEYVFLCAAKVGGIDANSKYPVEFMQDNLLIATNVIKAAAMTGVTKLMFMGSSCIYPRDCPQPIKEEYLLTGPLEPTNEAYALAKIAGLKLCQAYRRQCAKDFISVMPTNLYGPGDNYKPGCHVIPALIDRFWKAKYTTDPIPVWGDGTVRREFLYIDDLADACVLLMNHYSEVPPINIGVGYDITMKELAETVAKVVDVDVKRLAWDATKPSGTPRKWLDSSRLAGFNWKPKWGLEDGLRRALDDYMCRFGGKS